jgi:DNA-binding NarL/FixJ family response regulator
LLHDSGVDIPLLFLSHDLREETIIYTMQHGADDYIFKGSLNRLAPAIEHNLREARIRREHRAVQLALQENQTRLHAFIADLPGMAYQMLLQENGAISFPYVSEGCQACCIAVRGFVASRRFCVLPAKPAGLGQKSVILELGRPHPDHAG